MSLSLQEVTSAIVFQEWTPEQLASLTEAIQNARARVARAQKRQLSIGCKVKFTSNRTGSTYTGTVDKIKQKFVLVNTTVGRYNVPAHMLEIL